MKLGSRRLRGSRNSVAPLETALDGRPARRSRISRTIVAWHTHAPFTQAQRPSHCGGTDGVGQGGQAGARAWARVHVMTPTFATGKPGRMGAHLGTDVGRPGVSRRGETRAAVGRVETCQALWTLPRERCVSTTQRASALVAGPAHGARPFPGIVARRFGRCSRRRRLAPLRLASADRVRVHAEVRRGIHHDPRPRSTTTPDGSRRTPVRFFCVADDIGGKASSVKKK